MKNNYNPITGWNPIVEQQIEQQIQTVTIDEIKKILYSKNADKASISRRMCKGTKTDDYLYALDKLINSVHIYGPADLEWMVLEYE